MAEIAFTFEISFSGLFVFAYSGKASEPDHASVGLIRCPDDPPHLPHLVVRERDWPPGQRSHIFHLSGGGPDGEPLAFIPLTPGLFGSGDPLRVDIDGFDKGITADWGVGEQSLGNAICAKSANAIDIQGPGYFSSYFRLRGGMITANRVIRLKSRSIADGLTYIGRAFDSVRILVPAIQPIILSPGAESDRRLRVGVANLPPMSQDGESHLCHLRHALKSGPSAIQWSSQGVEQLEVSDPSPICPNAVISLSPDSWIFT